MTRVGVLGGGQLGRMLALAGYPLDVRCVFLDPAEDAPAGQLAEHVAAGYDDDVALADLASRADLVTDEFENVPVGAARKLAAKVPVWPPPRALEVAQDRLAEKTLFRSLGIPTAPFAAVDTARDLAAAREAIGLPAVLKTRREGYDGKGQAVARTVDELGRAFEHLHGRPLILEGFVPFERELSIVGARSEDGETAFYPLVENHHREGILRVTLAPAPGVGAALQAAAESEARRVMESLGYVGVLAIELFQHEGRLLANEMAPRVHNSGHWTIEGTAASQFENHLRAILGWPLGKTEALGRCAMVNLVGALPPLPSLAAVPGAHVHFYGKAPRAGRKVGHVTLVAADDAALREGLLGLAAIVDEPALRAILER